VKPEKKIFVGRLPFARGAIDATRRDMYIAVIVETNCFVYEKSSIGFYESFHTWRQGFGFPYLGFAHEYQFSFSALTYLALC